MSSSIQWWKPGHVHQQATMKFADLWDALFGKRETFIRVEHAGSWFICEQREAWEFKGTAYDGDVYVTTEVRMTRRQFNNLPEFEGF
jgi:hypothetical protein